MGLGDFLRPVLLTPPQHLSYTLLQPGALLRPLPAFLAIKALKFMGQRSQHRGAHFPKTIKAPHFNLLLRTGRGQRKESCVVCSVASSLPAAGMPTLAEKWADGNARFRGTALSQAPRTSYRTREPPPHTHTLLLQEAMSSSALTGVWRCSHYHI